MLTPVLFFITLAITVMATNKKNDAEASDENLTFEAKDSFIIFACFASSVLIDFIASHFFQSLHLVISLVAGGVYLMILIITNNNREKKIKKKHDEITNIYQALGDVLGRVNPEDIDFADVPFVTEEDPELHKINKITIDTSIPGGRFNDNTIILAQYSINKFFPDFQWVSKVDHPKRELTFKGLPKPPKIAMWKGSDYRPTGWIPLGLSGEGEVGWNIADPKGDAIGFSSYITEDGKQVGTIAMPSAPQCMTLGSTGGGKSIWVDQPIVVLKD